MIYPGWRDETMTVSFFWLGVQMYKSPGGANYNSHGLQPVVKR
jgi:hypothetical protein